MIQPVQIELIRYSSFVSSSFDCVFRFLSLLLSLKDMAEQMLEFFPQLDLHEYADILSEQESQLTAEERRLTSEAVASQSVLMTPFVTVEVEDDDVNVVDVVSSPPLTASTASTSCSSVLSRKQVVPRKNIKQMKPTVSGDDIDLDIVTPHVIAEPRKKAPAKKRAPKSTAAPIPKTITIVESSTSTKKRAAPVNSVASGVKKLKSSPLNEPLPTTTVEVATQTTTNDDGIQRIIRHIDSLFEASREEFRKEQAKHAKHIDTQFQASRGEFHLEQSKHTKLLRLVREMTVENAKEIQQIKETLHRGARISFQ